MNRAKTVDNKLSYESSISTDQDLEESMLREYWEDFDAENQIKSDMK